MCPGASDSDSLVPRPPPCPSPRTLRREQACRGAGQTGKQTFIETAHSLLTGSKEALYISSRRESCYPGIPLPILMPRWKMERPASAEPTPETRPGPPSTAVPGHSRACKRCDKKKEVQFRALHPSAGGGGCRQGHERLTGPGEGGCWIGDRGTGETN